METNELKMYAKMLRKRGWLIAAIVVLACTAAAIYSFMFVTPVYQASTKMIVNKAANNLLPAQPLNASEITANIMLVNTYKEIIKSRAIMDKVEAQYPELRMTSEQLIRRVSVSSLNDTQVMTLNVADPSHERAVNIVNAVTKVFQESIPDIMKIDNVAILNEANLSDRPIPVGTSPYFNIVVSFVASLLFAIGLSFLLEYMDDSIRSEQDIASVLGLPTYGVIPKIKSKDLTTDRRSKSLQDRLEEKPYATVNQ